MMDQMPRHRMKKRVELAGGRLAFSGLSRISKRLTPDRTWRWGSRLGDFIYSASSRYRRVALRNLALAYPEWSDAEVRRTARETFRHFGRGVLEFFYLLNLSQEEIDSWVTLEGKEHLDAAISKGNGAVLITAHLGNWELFARKVVLLGYKLNVIARDSDDPAMTGIANTVRQSGGYKVFGRDNAALPAIRCLRKNEFLGILPDQNTGSGIFVDFFGRPVATATGPAVFSIKTGAPIICGFARRTRNGFKGLFKPLDVNLSGDEEADVRAVTAAMTKAIEDEVREDPAQWLWLHDRWKRTHEAPVDGEPSEIVK